jgi:methylase of polypeptide subunit release factors
MSAPATTQESIAVAAAAYLHLDKTERIASQLHIQLSSHSYMPRVDDLQSDWVSHVAAPAFRLFRQRRGGAAIEAFCSIGTGSGLDVLTAIELLAATRVGLTDMHEEVVATAIGNVRRNLRPPHAVTIEAGFGDLLSPLASYGSRYDLIYENLPNVPLQNAEAIAEKRVSSAYVPPRKEALPGLVKQKMLDLHFLALQQSPGFLRPGGSVLSCLGARVPLQVFLSLGELAGFSSSILTYGWKVQDDASLIQAYAQHQENGYGPFHYYRADQLQRVFSAIDPATSGAEALRIERELQPLQLDPVAAIRAHEAGERIGHTVAVLESRLESGLESRLA